MRLLSLVVWITIISVSTLKIFTCSANQDSAIFPPLFGHHLPLQEKQLLNASAQWSFHLHRKKFTLFQAFFGDTPSQTIFQHIREQQAFAPPRYLAPGIVGSRAIPTNKWWGNYIAADKDLGLQPAWSNPYSIRPLTVEPPYGYAINYPYNSRVFGGSSGNGNAVRYYAHTSPREIALSAAEFTSPPIFQVTDWDDLGVSTQFLPQNGTGLMNASLVSGMAYVTVSYVDLTPRISTSFTMQSINGQLVTPGALLTGTRFLVEMNTIQTWALYSTNTEVTFRVDNISTLIATSKVNTVIRVVYMPDDSQQAIFDRFSGCIVQGGNVEALDESTYMFQWKTSGDCSNGLLHFAQQHHIDSFDTSTAAELPGIYSYSATRGLMRGVVTKSTLPVWKLVEKQDIPVDYYPANKPPSGLVQQYQILENLRNDIAANWDMPLWGSYYFNGKLAQKYAGLCLMANDPNVVGSNTSLLQSCLTKLRTVMTPMAQNSWTYPLVYDEIYRGIVSSQGFKVKDYWVDFGNTVYNDHHYHYGYWLVAAAIVNYLDPSWSELPRLNIVMGYLYRDVANPLEEGDTSFPKFRNFDWFRGHSYSHGVTPFADGKDEESTSEDINFHYGLYLYGLSIGNKRLHTIGKLMMKLNAHSIRTYVLLTKDNRIHPSNFVPNHVTGIYFDNKVDYATWFGAEKYKIHGIQMIPVTPVTEFVRTYDFVIQEWTDILSNLPLDNTNPWMSLLYVNYATINKQNALSVLQVVALDEGLSRSWALYMAASRPDRNSSS